MERGGAGAGCTRSGCSAGSCGLAAVRAAAVGAGVHGEDSEAAPGRVAHGGGGGEN